MMKVRPTALCVMLAAALGTSFAAGAHAARFSSVNSFGDSLSDAGFFEGVPGLQPRFTTNPDRVWIEHLADRVGPTDPAKRVHHSAGGARTSEQGEYPDPVFAPMIPTVTSQIDAHLETHPRLDRNGLYTVWSGANDVFNAVQTHQDLLTNPETAMQGAANVVADSVSAAQDVAGLTTRLQRAGAGTVLVMNLPNLGQTPLARASGAEEVFSLASQQFNAALHKGVSQAGGNVAMLDAYAMMGEVIATPKRFGLDDVTAPACTSDSAQTCTRDTLVAPDAHSRYLFADAVHPTGAGHALLADYAVSVLRAPEQMGLLAEAPMAGMALASRQTDARMRKQPSEETGIYLNIERDTARPRGNQRDQPGMRDGINALTLGLDRPFTSRLRAGVAVTHAQHRATVEGGRGSFELGQTLFSGYGQYRSGPWATSLTATAGVLDYGKVNRDFSIGAARLSERGKTSGMQYGLKAATRYDMTMGAFTVSPTLSLAANRVSVDAFDEKRDGRSATSMRYHRQTRQSLVSSVGVDLAGTWEASGMQFTPYARAAYEFEHNAKARSVRANVRDMAGSFSTPVRGLARHTGVLTLGLQSQVTRSMQVNLAYNARLSSQQRSQGVQAGVGIVF